MEGWAQDAAAPERPVRLEIFADGVLAARVLANRHRDDLAAAGLGSGRHAFRVPLRERARATSRRAAPATARCSAFSCRTSDSAARHCMDELGSAAYEDSPPIASSTAWRTAGGCASSARAIACSVPRNP